MLFRIGIKLFRIAVNILSGHAGITGGASLITNVIYSRLADQDPKGLQSIRRAVSILREISRNNDQGIRLSGICAEVGLKTSTAHRLLSSLLEEGMVNYDVFSKRYHLGFGLYKLGNSAYQYSILQYCRDAMERIAGETGDTVFLSMRSGTSGICLKRVEGAYPVRTLAMDEGSRWPLGIGASSLAILSHLPDGEIDQVIKFNRKFYAHYKQTEADVRKLIAISRRLGYVLYDRVLNKDIITVGLPIFDQGGKVVAALSVASIQSRMGKTRMEQIVRIMKSEIKHVSIPSL